MRKKTKIIIVIAIILVTVCILFWQPILRVIYPFVYLIGFFVGMALDKLSFLFH